MSLNVDWSKIKDWESFVPNKDPNSYEAHSGIATTFAFLTIIIGMREITEKNKKEFYLRCRAWEESTGALRSDGEGHPKYITMEEVEMFVGLSSNANDLTRHQFKKKLADSIFERLERETSKRS